MQVNMEQPLPNAKSPYAYDGRDCLDAFTQQVVMALAMLVIGVALPHKQSGGEFCCKAMLDTRYWIHDFRLRIAD